MLAILLLGFASGLPLALSATTLQAWFAVSNVDIITIGSLALVGQPYVLKFLWAPLLDRYMPPLFGRRRGWMLLTQIAISFALIAMSFYNPQSHPGILASLALLLAFFSASQDIAVDAYRVDVLLPEQRGLGAAMGVLGYRMGMLVSGAFALILADKLGWAATYQIMSVFMIVGMFASVLGPEPDVSPVPASLREAVIEPFREFWSRPSAFLILLFIVLYKLSEAFTSTSGVMTNAFLLQGLHFSLSAVGMVNKGIGLLATLLGVFLGGILLTRMRLYSALMLFGWMQALTNLLYMWLALAGKNYHILMIAVFSDNLSAGLGTAAVLAFMMALCDHRYSATQFALFTAIAAITRVVLGPLAGVMVEAMGWAHFFLWTFILALPGLLLLYFLERRSSFESQCSPAFAKAK